jgi:hypothetical protein
MTVILLRLWFALGLWVLGPPGDSSTSPCDTVWTVEVASRMALPPVCTRSCAWASHRGAIQAYSLADGSRLYRYKTRSTMRLYSLGDDSVLAFVPYRKGRVLVFESSPPGLLLRHTTRDPLLDADCRGSQATLLFQHGLQRLENGRWIPQAFPRAAVDGRTPKSSRRAATRWQSSPGEVGCP